MACVQGAWIAHERQKFASNVYTGNDGIDLYVDAARFLPDNVTVTRVRYIFSSLP